MVQKKKLTGYPSIDKPWLKYYRKKPIKSFNGIETVYDMIFKDCDLEAGAISPELIAVLIAIISIGACAKFFDIRASEKDIIAYVKDSNCKYMVCMDKIVLPKVINVIADIDLEKIFIFKLENSLSKDEKEEYLLGNLNDKEPYCCRDIIKTDVKFLDLSNIISSVSRENVFRAEYNENRPALEIQSSGTTGKAKTIVHSEKSIVETAKSFAWLDLPLGKGKNILIALPPWIAYGLGNAALTSLAMRSNIILCPDFEADAVYKNIGRFSFAYAAPFHYRYIRNHYDELSIEKKEKLKCVDALATGGDKYSAVENEMDEKLFGTIVISGYGNNECFGAVTVPPIKYNKYGSVGVPKQDDFVIIYDAETDSELPYNEYGEVCSTSNTLFLGYENNKEMTQNIKKLHKDGKYYVHTGDIGYMDEDGFVFLSGRKERVITRLGFKLSAYTIEDAITSLPYISECIVVEVPDKEEEHVPMAFVVLEKNCRFDKTNVIKQLSIDLYNILKENEIPKYFRVMTKLKYTDNNKYDFREYERIGKEYVSD